MSFTSIINPGKVSGFTRTDQGISGSTANSNFRITFFAPNVVNVRFSRTQPFQALSYAVIREAESGLTGFEASEACFLLSGDLFQVRLDRSDGRVSFLTLDGAVINADEPGLATTWNGEQVTTYKTLQQGEKFVGLGEKVGPLNRRGSGYQHWNTDAFAYGPGTDPVYSTIPFYIGIHNGLAYGIFFDNPAKTFFNFGASNNRTSSFYADNGEMNYYFFHGPSIADIIRAYTWLTGTITLPPLWSLGFQQCRYSYYPDKEVMSLARTFREKNIPADAIVLDIHYMDAYKIFTWHPQHFPEPEKLIADLKEDGFNVVVMCDPGIKAEAGYPPYDEGLNQGAFINYPDGTPYSGQVWPGWCHFPDFTDPQTRATWARWMKSYADAGVAGYWNDMNEFSSWGQMMPENLLFKFEGQGATARQGRNIYGLQMARATYEGVKQHLKGKRPFNLTRSGYAGIQRYAALWTGDNVSYDEHMMLGVRLVNSLGLSGVAFAGYDIGGFVGDASPKLFARWITIGAFSPFCRVHTMINSRDSEPWSYGEEVEIISRNYLRMRYQLLPYIYSLFHEAAVNGMPVQRSLVISHPHSDEVYNDAFQHQYLFGPDILVAPCESSKDIIKVWFPQGDWYNLNDGTVQAGDRIVPVDAPVHRLPVFVRGGAVIPMQEPVMHTGIKPDRIFLHVYKGAAGTTFDWYSDDGETFGFENGAYALRRISHDGSGGIHISPTEGTFRPQWKTIERVFHGFGPLSVITVDGAIVHATVETRSFFQPMEKFDPLADAAPVGSEQVSVAEINYRPSAIAIVVQ